LNDKNARIELRVTQSEKKKIARLAESCGLSQSEYIRQRTLGYAPRTVQPDPFLISTKRSAVCVTRLPIRYHLKPNESCLKS
jgi:uncharacterized protein (DUF1778 family)